MLFTADGLDATRLAAAIVRDTGDNFLLIDSSAVVVACNANVASALGHRPAGLLGRSILDIVDAADAERAGGLLPDSDEAGSPGGVSAFRVRRADGDLLVANIAGDTIHLDGKQYILFRGRAVYWPQAVERCWTACCTAPRSTIS